MHKSVKGFTLIELIVTILLIAIIAVSVAPKWPVHSLSLSQEIRRILHDIRYTQTLSMFTGERYRWVQLSGNSYQIVNAAGIPVLLPTGSTILTLTNDVTFGSLINLPNNLIAFDRQGIPYINTGIPGTALSATALIPLLNGGQTHSVTITPQTGYASWQ